MIYSEEKAVLFAHVSRTGGTTISNHLRRLLRDSRILVGPHAPLIEARSLLGEQFDHAFKFAFVRNPWDRIASWYALIVQTKYAKALDRAALIDPDAKHWRSFDAFLENWCAQNVQIAGVTRRQHSQWAQLTDADGMLLTNDIGRFENYKADLRRLFAHANLALSEDEKANTSQHLHYSVYYSRFGRELIAHAFPEDILNLGYQFAAELAAPSNAN